MKFLIVLGLIFSIQSCGTQSSKKTNWENAKNKKEKSKKYAKQSYKKEYR